MKKQIIFMCMMILLMGGGEIWATLIKTNGGLAELPDPIPNIEFYTDGIIQDGDEYYNVNVYLSSVVNMTGGKTTFLNSRDSSTLNVSGGNTSFLTSHDKSTINITGGNIFELEVQSDLSLVNIFGYNFSETPSSSDTILNGYWGNGTPFTMRLRRDQVLDLNIVYHEIPEPFSVWILLMGSVLMRRRLV